MKRLRYPILMTMAFFVCAIALPTPIPAQEGTPKPVKLFKADTEMNVTLTGPWRTIMRNVKKDAMYPAQLSWTDEQGRSQSLDIQVAPRGISRRNYVCKFPPLKLHFDKEKADDTPFRGNKSLKMVTYCDANKRYEQYNLKEFLVYKINNLVSSYSFLVRPMTISYKDSERSGDPIVRFGFMIEDLDELADRHDMIELGLGRVTPNRLDSLETSRLALFQLLVGNLDWASTGGPDPNRCCHNSRLIGTAENASPVYAVPYDFDATGLVNTHYSAPPDKLGVRRITDRLYRGFCVHNDTLAQARDEINGLQKDIIDVVRAETRLTDRSRDRAVEYLEDFFELVRDPEIWQKRVVDKCRK